MQLKTILNLVEPYKSFVYQQVRWADSETKTEIEVLIEPRKNGRAICSGCNKPCPGYDRLPARRFAFVPLWQIAAIRADGVSGSGIADFCYNRATGALILDTDGQTAVSLLVAGPPAMSIDRFTGFDAATGTNWGQGYFAGEEQWIELSLTGVQGAFKIATYVAGLTESGFGAVEYGTAGGGIALTQVTSLLYAADFDRDQDVDGGDLSRWNLDYGANELSDANNDGLSNGTEFLLWQRAVSPNPHSATDLALWQGNCSIALPLASSRAVPEPTGFLLMLLQCFSCLLSHRHLR